MLSRSALLTLFLLIGASFNGYASALPHDALSAREITVIEPTIAKRGIEGQVQTRNPGHEAFGETDVHQLQTRGLDIKFGNAGKAVNCPATNNGPNRDYAAHSYTAGQVKAAMFAGAKLGAAGKTLGPNNYPHFFGNNEAIPFPCGRNKQEWPIRMDNNIYNGEPPNDIPDRVVYEYKETKSDYVVTFCGVMRHGPNNPFLNCA